MANARNTNDDLFSPGRGSRVRQSLSPRELRHEVESAGAEPILQALVAAAVIIARADGRVELVERRRLVEAFLANPSLRGFSVADLGQELAGHLRAYDDDPAEAEDRALSSLATLQLSAAERRTIHATCTNVVAADSLVHPAELGALHRVEVVLGLGEGDR